MVEIHICNEMLLTLLVKIITIFDDVSEIDHKNLHLFLKVMRLTYLLIV